MDTATKFNWELIECDGSGNELDQRKWCSATLVGRFIWVLGGLKQEERVSVLDTEERRWKEVYPQLNGQEFCLFHSTVLYNDNILVYGVRGKAAHEQALMLVSPDFYAFDLLTHELVHIPSANPSSRPAWQASQVVEFYAQKKALVIVNGSLLGAQLHLFILRASEWKCPNTRGRPPSINPLASVTACLVGSMLVIHDLNRLHGWSSCISCIDLEGRNQLVWSSLPNCGQSVNRRGPSLSYVGSGRILLFGGHIEDQSANQLLIVEHVKSRAPELHQVQDSRRNGNQIYAYTGEPPGPCRTPQVFVMHDKVVVVGTDATTGANVHFLTPKVSS